MLKTTLTHTANCYRPVVGHHVIRLRETKNFWVDVYGQKYRKSDGYATGFAFAVVKIDLGTLEPINFSK